MGYTNCNPCDPCGTDQNAAKAAVYARQAKTSATNAENSWLEFNALYLGAFASAPTVDNEGNPLQVGALYWNSVSNELFVWNGASWEITTNFNEFTPFLATGTTTPRNLVTRFADVVNVLDFGADPTGVLDSYPQLQSAANAASGKILFIPQGTYLLSTGSVQILSNTTVVGAGVGITILIQPNYFTYNRPIDPYVPANVVDWNALWMDVGTTNVVIRDIEARGPFYQSTAANYIANPVQNWPASNGIAVRGRDYQLRKSLPPVGESQNIRISNVKIEGFAEDAIQLDNVTNSWVEDCNITRCGRSGVRTYGAVNCWVSKNQISYLSPGDYLNNGNRMYGVTFTRVYGGDLTDYRVSQVCSATENKVYHVKYWKGLDTHGGVNISFNNNIIEECHIGIGIDKGGSNVSQGIAPPKDISIVGNSIKRTLPDDPLEAFGVVGPGLFIVAHDQTDLQVGRNIVVSSNIIEGWGEDIRFGAVYYSNWIGVNHSNNTIVNSRRAAIATQERFEGSLANDVIDNVRRSTLGVQVGISVEDQNNRGKIDNFVFINREANQLSGISLTTPSSNNGFTIGSNHRFIDISGGTIRKVLQPQNSRGGQWITRLLGAARVNAAGAILGQTGEISVTKTGTGTYEVSLLSPAIATASLWPIASSQNTLSARFVSTASTSTSTSTVYIRDFAGNLVDDIFIIHIFGY